MCVGASQGSIGFFFKSTQHPRATPISYERAYNIWIIITVPLRNVRQHSPVIKLVYSVLYLYGDKKLLFPKNRDIPSYLSLNINYDFFF